MVLCSSEQIPERTPSCKKGSKPMSNPFRKPPNTRFLRTMAEQRSSFQHLTTFNSSISPPPRLFHAIQPPKRRVEAFWRNPADGTNARGGSYLYPTSLPALGRRVQALLIFHFTAEEFRGRRCTSRTVSSMGQQSHSVGRPFLADEVG